MPLIKHCALLVLLVCSVNSVANTAGPISLDPARVLEIEKMLTAHPKSGLPSIDDRVAWKKIAEQNGFDHIIAAATVLLKKPMPELPDDVFLDFSRTGNRSRGQSVIRVRQKRLRQLFLAECIENRARFLPAIEDAILKFSKDKTWVYPAHDRQLENFHGETVQIDLFSASFSWDMATVGSVLSTRLSPKIRRTIKEQLEYRTFKPMEDAFASGNPSLFWLTRENNWNAVCLAGVTGAALANIESPKKRAWFIAAAEKQIEYFLKGFTNDGYCTEGIAYWNYGYGHFVYLGESIHQATNGKLDLFNSPVAKKNAAFPFRIQLTNNIYPPFSDCGIHSVPSQATLNFVNRRYGFGVAQQKVSLGKIKYNRGLSVIGLMGLENSATRTPDQFKIATYKLRDWFPTTGVLVARPDEGKQNALAVAIKGGSNAEVHNHNDVGTYVVTVGGGLPLVDPGSEIYTARTFSKQRYESPVINSFGHPVPRVAGKLQSKGKQARAKVLAHSFSKAKDELTFDIASAYDVPELKKLRRTFVFSRTGLGSLTVADSVEFDSPQKFETALITFEKWEQSKPDVLIIGEGKQAVRVKLSSSPETEIIVRAETLEADLHGGQKPTRLGLQLKGKILKGSIALTITPVE